MTNTKLPPGLWPHQIEAVETADAFLRRGRTDQAGLVTMPTGTGKSGVIATIVAALPSVQGHRLVLTPWDGLVRQLILDIRERFWRRLPETSRPSVPRVRRLQPSSALLGLTSVSEPTIFVATIAAVSVAWRRAEALGYQVPDVFRNFGVVIVDEGHYEPAPDWSQAIRGLSRPTVLLTATPYRNDRKYFEIDRQAYYRFPHWRAREERFLREPQFCLLRSATSPDGFAEDLIAELSNRFPTDPDVRVIVRCETATSIRLVVAALRSLGQTVIGVHERFEAGGEVLRRDVPLPEQSDARFWVHQNKLIEGIDDPRFKALAFHEALRNGRALVQQIGRVLRNPQRDPNDDFAYVLGRGDRDVERTWTAYRSFDRQDEAESAATMPELVDRMIAVQPGAYYYDGAYRTRVDLDSPDAWKEFAFPLRTRVFHTAGTAKVSLLDLARAIADEWRKIDRTVYTIQTPDSNTAVIPFVAVENSRLLKSGLFIETEFGYTVCRLTSEFLFMHDTQGRTPQAVQDNYRPVMQQILRTLFPSGRSRLTSVALINTDIGPRSARARHLRANAIEALAPDLADYTYACTIAEGYAEGPDRPFRRYLGLSRARITDHRATELDYATYDAWLQEIESALVVPGEEAATFARYASLIGTPKDTGAGHVLLDIDEASYRQAGSGDPLRIEDVASDVEEGAFTITVNGRQHGATIAWDGLRQRYDVRCASLEEALFVTTDGQSEELLSVINSDQALRVVTRDSGAVYAHGEFFKPIIPATRAGAFRLLDVLYATPELETAGSEKGSEITGDDWEPTCVFGLISAMAPSSPRIPPPQMSAALDRPDFLLCTDLGTEVADFVATQGGRICFIHAKASRQRRLYSASALHDVASQAVKNLPYLQALSEVPMATGSWTRPWSVRDVDGSTRRLREGAYTRGRAMWTHIRSVVAEPNADREIWLVLGQSLSKNRLEREARNRPPKAEAIQVFALLQATWSAASQLGCRLRVFCSP